MPRVQPRMAHLEAPGVAVVEVDVADDLSRFKVGVPGLEIVRLPKEVYDRFRSAIDRSGLEALGWTRRWQDDIRDVTWMEGEAHPLVIAGLMAIAQGHDLNVISEKIESQV